MTGPLLLVGPGRLLGHPVLFVSVFAIAALVAAVRVITGDLVAALVVGILAAFVALILGAFLRAGM